MVDATADDRKPLNVDLSVYRVKQASEMHNQRTKDCMYYMQKYR